MPLLLQPVRAGGDPEVDWHGVHAHTLLYICTVFCGFTSNEP